MSLVREKETIIAILVGCMILYAVFSLTWMWMAALAIGLAATCWTSSARVIDKVGFWIVENLGDVMSRVILGTLFVIILLPMALLAKNIPQRFHDVEKELQRLFCGKTTPAPSQGS